MSVSVKAWVCEKPGEPMHEREVELPALGPDDVEIKIKACGICSSDMMILKAPVQIPPYQFPLVAGHEGVGYITQVGPQIKHLKVGDAVGVGLQRDCCRFCSSCREGDDIVCLQRTLLFAEGNVGCFGEKVRTNARFAYKLPEGMDMIQAAPLMCAGITSFTPFRVHNVKAGDRVGIVGIGGLGHLAIQFANRFGCEVYAFSSSPDKEAEAKKYGAHHFVTDYKTVSNKIDFLLVTATGKLDWAGLIGTLAKRGKLVCVALSRDQITVEPMTLISKSISLHGSAAGGSYYCADMLEFVKLHNIQTHVEVLPFNQVNEGIEKIAKAKMFGRLVLVRDD